MFGEFIVVGGITLITGVTSSILEDMGKEKAAKYLDLIFHGGMIAYTVKILNDAFDEITDSFL